uniref:Uncharacterized protein n=1 Tax=Desulfovibrio sp. U5L TaxID=596152 RepID=I2Q6K3_9BACT
MESQNDIQNATGQPNGATGGIGYTGNTGGPGLPGGPINPFKTNDNTPLSIDDLTNEVRKERINMFVGMTGGVGLPGDIERNERGEVVSAVSTETEAQLNKLALDKIDKMDLDELKTLITDNNRELLNTLNKVHAHNGNRAYTIGRALQRVKYLTESANLKNGFSNWMKDNLDKRTLSKRTCQKYLDIARMGDVLDYLPLGIEKLAALSPILKQMEDLDANHPIRDFIEKFGVNLKDCPDVEAMRFEIGVGMSMAKIKRYKIKGITKKLVTQVMECGFELNKKDLEAMKATQEAGGSPAKYLENIIKFNKRPGAPYNAGGNTSPRNLMEQAQEIRDTVSKLLKAPTIKGEINVDRIDALIQDLEALKSRLKSSASAATDSSAMQTELETGASMIPPTATGTSDTAAAAE